VPLSSMHGTYTHIVYRFAGDSAQSWVMVSRSKQVLEDLRKLVPKGYEERIRQIYIKDRMPVEVYEQRVEQPYFEIISFDEEGRMIRYGTREEKARGPRNLGRPWTDDYSNFIGALR